MAGNFKKRKLEYISASEGKLKEGEKNVLSEPACDSLLVSDTETEKKRAFKIEGNVQVLEDPSADKSGEGETAASNQSPSAEQKSPTPTPKDMKTLMTQLTLDLKKNEEQLRKLKLVKMYREKNNLEELQILIDKWRDVCHQSLQDLYDMLPSPRPTLQELLDHLQIDYDLVKFDPNSESFS